MSEEPVDAVGPGSSGGVERWESSDGHSPGLSLGRQRWTLAVVNANGQLTFLSNSELFPLSRPPSSGLDFENFGGPSGAFHIPITEMGSERPPTLGSWNGTARLVINVPLSIPRRQYLRRCRCRYFGVRIDAARSFSTQYGWYRHNGAVSMPEVL